jgi:transposase InsO family protein
MPNMPWLSDFTYVAAWTGFVYVAFVIDAYARRIIGWRVSLTAHASFVLDALEQANALFGRRGAGAVYWSRQEDIVDRHSHTVPGGRCVLEASESWTPENLRISFPAESLQRRLKKTSRQFLPTQTLGSGPMT